MPDLRFCSTLCLFAAAAALAQPSAATLPEFAGWFVRPATLPFAWQALDEATRSGDAQEAFARGQQIARLLPGWTAGYCVFAYRYVLAEDAGREGDEAATAAEARLAVALAWLDEARAEAGARELELLQLGAFLPEVAAREFPALEARLAPRGGSAALCDRWLAEAERRYPTAAVRERRTFYAPVLAGALLTAGDRHGALAVLEAAIQRTTEVRDQELAAEWRERLVAATRWLAGDRTVDLGAVLEDPRMEPLRAHLR